jgi:transposase
LTAAGSGEEVVPASDYRALQSQIRELHRLLGKKTLEAISDRYVVLKVARHSKGSVTAWRRERRSNFAVLWQ